VSFYDWMFALHLMSSERRRLKLFSFDEGWRLLGDPVEPGGGAWRDPGGGGGLDPGGGQPEPAGWQQAALFYAGVPLTLPAVLVIAWWLVSNTSRAVLAWSAWANRWA